ncbi:MAG: DUF3857 domain-containing protein [Deltaproteobacteria bacterium]|nr:DUF3857 domain-containing protein [Deltaproteobacteria bacterium]
MTRRALVLVLQLATSTFTSRAFAAGPYEDDVDASVGDVLSLRDSRAIVPLLDLYRSWDLVDPDRIEAALDAVTDDDRVSVEIRAYARWLQALARLRRGDAAGARSRVAALGFVRDWLVVGPFDNEGKAGFGRADPPEAPGPIDLGRGFAGKEREVFWRSVPAGVADLGTLWFDSLMRPNVNVCAYGQTFVSSVREQRVTLLASGGGAVEVWVNGEVALTDGAYRGVDVDRVAASVTLRPGWNRVLAKTCVAEGQWALALRFAGPDGLAASSLSFSSAPEHAAAASTGAPPRAEPREWILGALQRKASGRGLPVALMDLARYLRWTGGDDPDERLARRHALRAVDLAPTVENLLFASQVAEDRNERGRMLARAEAAGRSGRQDPELLVAQAAWTRTGPRPEAALGQVSRALAIDGRFFTAVLERAAVYAEVGMPLWALSEIRSALDREPAPPAALLRAAADYAEAAGLPDESLAMRRAYLEAHADDSGSSRSVAGELAARGDHEGARRTALKMIALRPDSVESYAFAAETLESIGDVEGADRMHQRLTAILPEDAAALVAYGRFSARSGRVREAVSLFRRALAFRPQDAELREYLDHLEPADRAEEELVADAEALKAAPRQRGSEGYAARVLQDLTVQTVYDNGLGSSFRQVVIEVLSDEGARRYQQYSIQYDPSGQRVDVRVARVLRRAGGVDQAVQRYDQSLSEPWYSLYYDIRADVVMFPRLEVGDVIELQYRVDDVAHRNLFADYFGDITFLQSTEPRQRVGYVLVGPASRSFYFNEPALPGLRKNVERRGGQKIHSFFATDVPAVVAEELMPGFAEVAAYVHVSTYRTWDEVGRWYWGLVREQFQADDSLQATVRRLTDGITEPRAKARVIYDWVVANTRYVGLEFGIHGFKPYRTSQVVSRGFGDCKDKATLLVTMLEEAGVAATIVLVRTRRNGSIAPYPASLAVFDHAIAYVPSLDLWLDGTAEHSGSGELPAQDQGVSVLVVNQGNAILTRTPVVPAEQNRRERTLRVRLSGDGTAVVLANESVGGSAAASFRDRYEAEGTREERVEQAVSAIYPGADVESYAFESALALEEAVRFSYRARVPQYARLEGGGLSLPIAPEVDLTRSLARVSTRRQDIDLGAPWELIEDVTTELPAAMRAAHAPQDARIESEFGLFELDVDLRGREVRVQKRLALRRDRIGRGEYARFREFCHAVDAALDQRLTLVRE